LFFFFFKQKTAYEILAWLSSDVCSSDLSGTWPVKINTRLNKNKQKLI